MKKRIKVCTVISGILGGGVESVLINFFSHLNRDNYELDLITYCVESQECKRQLENLGFNIIEIPPKRNGFLKSNKAMREIIKNGHYDIIHAHITEWNCLPMYYGKKANVPIRISHSHLADISKKSFIERLLFKFQQKMNEKFATKLCACGEKAADYLYSKRRRKDVEIIYNGIDINKFRFNQAIREKVRGELGLQNEFVIGNVGRFTEQKNHGFLIDTFDLLHKKYPNSKLLLLGQGHLMDLIKKKVESLNLVESVIFLGVKTNPNDYYQAMDLFLLPSLYEGFPVSGIEAQANGLPSIFSSNISREVIINSNVTLLDLCISKEEWVDSILIFSNRSREKVADTINIFNIDVCVKKWEKLYKDGSSI